MEYAQQNEEPLSLETLCEGHLKKEFEIEIEKLCRNIADMDTTDETRTLSIKIGIKPVGENRSTLQVGFKITPHHAPRKSSPITGAIMDRGSNGKLVIREFRTPKQATLEFPQKTEGGES